MRKRAHFMFFAASQLLAATGFASYAGAETVFSAVGQNGTDIQGALDAFRASLGPIAAGPSTGAGPDNRREVNWDAVPDAFSSGNVFPGNFFNQDSSNPAGRVRGLQLSTPGTFEVSADADSDNDGNPGPVAPLFGNRHPDNPADFAAFSPERIFGINGSNVMDVTFSVPGSPGTTGLSRGFGAVFTDVEEEGTTKLEFYDALDNLLTTQEVPFFPLNGAGDTFKSFSFVGVAFDDPSVARVHITVGSMDLSLVSFGPGNDVAAMDDFVYGEPVPVPEPTTAALALLGVAALGLAKARRA